MVGQLDLVTLILMSAGIFFLLLLFISIMLPWITFESDSRSGFDVAIGIILFVFDLFIMGAVVTALVLGIVLRNATVVNRLVSYSVAAAFWLGTFAFFGLFAGLIRPWGLGKGVGLWMAFFSALFLTGIFGYLAFRRPPELPVNPDPNSFVRKWLLLVGIGGSAAFLGLLVFLIHII
jgi:hypothetical protein